MRLLQTEWVTEETKHDNLLPKLQGKADEFDFTQLLCHTISLRRPNQRIK